MNGLTTAFQAIENSYESAPDLVCLSHLRWDFVYQRPQHLLSRCAHERRVFFIEEPVFNNEQLARLEMTMRDSGVCVVIPHLPKGLSEYEVNAVQRLLIDEMFDECGIRDYLLWYYTPMALAFTDHLSPLAIIYDCLDELSAFKGAPRIMKEREAQLLARADVVFTGGQSLYEFKRDQHSNIHPFPSSIDAAHFAQARTIADDPADQAAIPHPRLGFFGVIDERMDLALLDSIAEARPDWHLVMIGPVVKISQEDLPRRSNIHYLGGKDYKELPAYLAGWDVALMPFARNESTRFISPTKTPEYLAAGKPVVSTSIRDVVRPYGRMSLVEIADDPAEFIAAVEKALKANEEMAEWLNRVDGFLAQTSWDRTWMRMMSLIESTISNRLSENTSLVSLPGGLYYPTLIESGKSKISNAQVRLWYKETIAQIPKLNEIWIKEGLSARKRAKRAWRIRKEARLAARNMMVDHTEVELLKKRDIAIYGTPGGPSFKSLIEKHRQEGLEGDAIYEAIIEESYRTNYEINKKLDIQ